MHAHPPSFPLFPASLRCRRAGMVCCPPETRTRVYDTQSPRYAGIARCAANSGASQLWRPSRARVAGVTGHNFRPGRLILASRSAGFQWVGRCSPVGFVSRFAREATSRRLVPSYSCRISFFYQLARSPFATDCERSDRNIGSRQATE